MTKGEATMLFSNINTDLYSDEDKLLAIREVLQMETHNSISKADILEAFKWLFDYAIEEVEEA